MSNKQLFLTFYRYDTIFMTIFHLTIDTNQVFSKTALYLRARKKDKKNCASLFVVIFSTNSFHNCNLERQWCYIDDDGSGQHDLASK